MTTTTDRLISTSDVMGIATYLADAVLAGTVTVPDAVAALNEWLSTEAVNLTQPPEVAADDAETLLDLATQFVSGCRALATATVGG